MTKGEGHWKRKQENVKKQQWQMWLQLWEYQRQLSQDIFTEIMNLCQRRQEKRYKMLWKN